MKTERLLCAVLNDLIVIFKTCNSSFTQLQSNATNYHVHGTLRQIVLKYGREGEGERGGRELKEGKTKKEEKGGKIINGRLDIVTRMVDSSQTGQARDSRTGRHTSAPSIGEER